MIMSHEMTNFLHRVLGRHARTPARDVALWLACIPLVLPAPLIAGFIAVSARLKGSRDQRWPLVMVLSVVNFVLSAVAIIWVSTLFGSWLVERLNELFGPFFLWPPISDPKLIAV